ncbi:alpha/beta fold hydrolase [Micromonospora purpureochromogenes]|uniref:Pimeloyl-ACP methyl ester carboxylesterase n=1 Tax=Micromonospora purpureochromogenes TaxID=47872 RepID=A0ABX2RDB9_9ACTN|nr:alpha/beta fold hydrolase [Micromonospora purpureochromogenes]NYF54482.1 pimeloyl-ACP methyl ester carboxylesterase [Micromonospora purpureochromogenes]
MSYADVNGLHLWYETHGSGRPLVLLHGGYGAVEMFAPVLPALAQRRQVIAVDLQGHGRTADVDRPLRYESMAEDVAALLRHLDLSGADVLGYSLGGGVALRTAIQHPGLVRRLVLVSTPCRRQGWYPEVLAAMAAQDERVGEQMRGTPPHELYARIAPRPQDWPRLWAKGGELLRREYDWSAEVAALTVPTMLVYADADSIPVTHMAEFFGLLGGGRRDAGWDGTDRPASRLAVLPGLTHYDIVAAPALPAAVLPFLTHEVRAPQ